MKAAVFAALLALPAAAEDFALPPPPPGPHIDYSAEQVEFDADHSSLHLSSGVVLKDSTMTVKGQDLWIDTSRRRGRSDASLLVEDGYSAVYGDSGEFDFSRRTARLFHTSAGTGNWRIHAREGELRPDRSMMYRKADFTSCDRVPPDYHFHASSLYVVPKKYLLGKNTLFYLGKVPMFYTPFFYKSLDPDHFLKWRFHAGNDTRDGYYLKGTLTTQWTPTIYSKLFDDYYEKMGFGYGAELDHNAGIDSRGSLFGYRIHEAGTVRNRWGLFGSGYKAFGATSFQTRIQFQSDPRFTNDYIRSDVFRLTPELVNSAALSHSFSNGVVRLLYARNDIQNSDTLRYVKNTETIPRVEAQSTSFRLWKLPWLNTVSAFADNNYTRGRPFLQKTVGSAWQATRSVPLIRGLSYTPSLTFSETYYNRFDNTNYLPRVTTRYLDSTVGRWSASNNLRTRTPLGNIDATHVYSKRLKPDAFTEDSSPADKGVESNRIILSDVFVPAPRTWARVATAYDFATFRDHVVGFDQRVQPITTDLSWQSTQRLIFTLHNDYQLGPRKGFNRSVIFDVRWGDEKGVSVGGGIGYNLTNPGTYYQSLDFSFAPSSPTWRITVGLRTLVESDGGIARAHSGRLFEKEFTWTRRWHDFYTKVIGRIRPGGVGEITGTVELRFGNADQKHPERRDWESEWFPGRAKDSDELRP